MTEPKKKPPSGGFFQRFRFSGSSVSTSDESISITGAAFEERCTGVNTVSARITGESTSDAIRYAEYAIVVGHRVYAFGDIEFHTERTAPERAGSYPSSAILQPLVHPALPGEEFIL